MLVFDFVFGGVVRGVRVARFDGDVWCALVDGVVVFFEWLPGCGVGLFDCLVDAWICEGLNV